jgi:hypothetical protein
MRYRASLFGTWARAAAATRGQVVECEAALVVAQLFGIEGDAKCIIRWLIAAMVMRRDRSP